MNGRKAVGCELKASYYRQAVKNLAAAERLHRERDDSRQKALFAVAE